MNELLNEIGQSHIKDVMRNALKAEITSEPMESYDEFMARYYSFYGTAKRAVDGVNKEKGKKSIEEMSEFCEDKYILEMKKKKFKDSFEFGLFLTRVGVEYMNNHVKIDDFLCNKVDEKNLKESFLEDLIKIDLEISEETKEKCENYLKHKKENKEEKSKFENLTLEDLKELSHNELKNIPPDVIMRIFAKDIMSDLFGDIENRK